MQLDGYLKKRSFILISFIFILVQGCGSGSSETPRPVVPTTLKGVIAKGSPINGALITVKGVDGKTQTTASDSDGHYTVVVDGLTPPYLLRADLPSGDVLFSLGSQGGGVVNIHPLTDLIVGTWYKLHGKSVVDAFSNPAEDPAPDRGEVAALSIAIRQIVQAWLESNGLDPSQFDLISTPFEADHRGFDRLLDMLTITVDASGVPSMVIVDTTTSIQQTTTLDVDASGGSILVGTLLTTGSGETATSTFSSIIVSVISNPPAPTPIALIEVTPTSLILPTGQIQSFSAVAKDASGAAIDGVSFTWSLQSKGETPIAIINGNGQVMGLRTGEASVTASSGGITSNTATLTVVPGTTVDLTIGTPNGLVGITFPSVAVGISFPTVAIGIEFPSQIRGGIAGKVTDAATGTPIPGAVVRAFLLDIMVASTVTDHLGAFTLVSLAPDRFRVEASAAGYASNSMASVEVAVGATTQGINILLGRE